jgi:transcriptional regulator with XRE-family HTH domain
MPGVPLTLSAVPIFMGAQTADPFRYKTSIPADLATPIGRQCVAASRIRGLITTLLKRPHIGSRPAFLDLNPCRKSQRRTSRAPFAGATIGPPLALEELSARSGISRATLSRTENNEVSPTAAVLGRLCAAFELTMSRLLAEVEQDHPALVVRQDQPIWIDPETGYRRRSLSPPRSDFDCEFLYCELPADRQIIYPSPTAPWFGRSSIP